MTRRFTEEQLEDMVDALTEEDMLIIKHLVKREFGEFKRTETIWANKLNHLNIKLQELW